MEWKTDLHQNLNWNSKLKSLLVPIDIDPPFVAGESFNLAGADPSFCLHNGVLYMVFVDGGCIKIAVIDQATMSVQSLLRTISAPGASRPRLIFERSTYAGELDLPHVAYVGDDGKVYCYREQYLEDLSIEAITDEIGVGTCIEAIQLDDCFYHFYISAGALYVRKQGEYSNTLITPGSGEITEVWAAAMPDGRILLQYSLATSAGGGVLYNAYTNMMLPLEGGSDSFELGASLTSWLYKTGTFVFGKSNEYQVYSEQDDGFELAASLQMLKIYMMGQIANESFQLAAMLSKIIFSAPISFTESFELSAVLSKVVLSAPHDFTDSFQLSASLQSVSFT